MPLPFLASGAFGFFTMEYVAGGSLEQFWQSHGRRLVPVDTVVDVISQVCRGLAVAHDEKLAAWCFGPRQEAQNDYLATLEAPNFTLPDKSGKPHSLSDFRGKKVLLITWASW